MILVRLGQSADLPFVFNSHLMEGVGIFMATPHVPSAWIGDEQRIMRGLLEDPEKNLSTIRRLYFSAEHRRLERLLQTDRLLVAADPADPGHIVGWLLDPSGTGHVKGPFRSLGIADELAAFARG